MIIDFLKTASSKEKLTHALEILREFRDCESDSEYIFTMFVAWAKLEQLEEFLTHLVSGDPLKEDTVQAISDAALEHDVDRAEYLQDR